MSVFRFKEFVVTQENCPMKINTDGVLLGALADVEGAKRICDIGTGTGVIALMLAQRNHISNIDALDIDEKAVITANANFKNSVFNERLNAFHNSFIDFFNQNLQNKYDLIISNPPFFINSLHSPSKSKSLARHTNYQFFINLLEICSSHLNDKGKLQIVVPLDISELLISHATNFNLYNTECIEMKSFVDKSTFRHILKFERDSSKPITKYDFIIYESKGKHSLQYINALRNFFTIF